MLARAFDLGSEFDYGRLKSEKNYSSFYRFMNESCASYFSVFYVALYAERRSLC